jgi:hypothetical protein
LNNNDLILLFNFNIYTSRRDWLARGLDDTPVQADVASTGATVSIPKTADRNLSASAARSDHRADRG